ncbi:MAG: hypothetical protein K2G01_04480, partial [Paramuribaculum sp.]|nr:hypothetical protein [Paramuribaculum sp.]
MSNRFSASERRGTIVVVILLAISVCFIAINRGADSKIPEAAEVESELPHHNSSKSISDGSSGSKSEVKRKSSKKQSAKFRDDEGESP